MSSLSLLALAAIPLFSRFAQAQSCTPMENVKLTFYGYPDGPGDTTSFGCSGSTMVASTAQNPPAAGGSGSYNDPFTMATMAGSTTIKECELVYVPYLKKYFRYADHCSGCGKFLSQTCAPLRGKLIYAFCTDSNHIDLWIGTDTNGGQAQLTCETDLGTSQQSIIVNPPNGLDVDAQNLWDGTCHKDQFFPNADASSACSGGSTGGGSSSAAAPPPASSSAAAVIPSSSPAAPPPVNTPSPVQATTPAAQQPTSTPGSPGQGPLGQPTTLQTVASSPASINEPTGTPLATANGVCKTAGAAVCSADGKQIGICKVDMTVVFVDVAPGTKCVNGGMVSADS